MLCGLSLIIQPFIDIRTTKVVVCKKEGTTLKSLGIVAKVLEHNKTLLNEWNEKDWVLSYLSTHLTYHKGIRFFGCWNMRTWGWKTYWLFTSKCFMPNWDRWTSCVGERGHKGRECFYRYLNLSAGNINTLDLPTNLAPFNNEHMFWKMLHQPKLLTEAF